MITVACLRAVARHIDTTDEGQQALVCRAAHATRAHLSAAPVAGSLRALGWCDVDVREAVAAVAEGQRALEGAG